MARLVYMANFSKDSEEEENPLEQLPPNRMELQRINRDSMPSMETPMPRKYVRVR